MITIRITTIAKVIVIVKTREYKVLYIDKLRIKHKTYMLHMNFTHKPHIKYP